MISSCLFSTFFSHMVPVPGHQNHSPNHRHAALIFICDLQCRTANLQTNPMNSEAFCAIQLLWAKSSVSSFSTKKWNSTILLGIPQKLHDSNGVYSVLKSYICTWYTWLKLCPLDMSHLVEYLELISSWNLCPLYILVGGRLSRTSIAPPWG